MMRLMILERGHRARARLFMRMARRLTGHRIDAVAQMALYRPRFFGGPMFALGGDILRGPSYWTAAEREFLGAFVSGLNECPFCVRIHTEMTRVESRDEIQVDDTSSVRPQLAAVLPLLEKATRTPELVGREDVDAVRAAGLPDGATADAMYIALLFNVMNRLANAFDLTWDSDDHVRVGANVIHRTSYRLPRFLVH
jgi:AhpD family alkylhydroperoxidase